MIGARKWLYELHTKAAESSYSGGERPDVYLHEAFGIDGCILMPTKVGCVLLNRQAGGWGAMCVISHF